MLLLLFPETGKWNITDCDVWSGTPQREGVLLLTGWLRHCLQHVLTPSRQTEIPCWKLEDPHYSRSHLHRALRNSRKKVWPPWDWREERKEAWVKKESGKNSRDRKTRNALWKLRSSRAWTGKFMWSLVSEKTLGVLTIRKLSVTCERPRVDPGVLRRGGGHHEDSGFQLICVLCPSEHWDLSWCLEMPVLAWIWTPSPEAMSGPRAPAGAWTWVSPPSSGPSQPTRTAQGCGNVILNMSFNWSFVSFVTPYRVILLYIKILTWKLWSIKCLF